MKIRVLTAALSLATFCAAQQPRQFAKLNADVPMKQIAVCNQGAEIIGIDAQHKVHVWTMPLGTHRFLAAEDSSVAACSPDGKTLALVTKEGGLTIVDASKNKNTSPISISAHIPNYVDVSNGGLVATALAERPPRLVRGTQAPIELQTNFGGTNGIAISGDGSLVATADTDTMVRIYDAAGKLKSAIDVGPVEPFFVAFSPNAKEVYVSGADGVIRTVDVATAKVARTSERFGTASLGMMMSGAGDQALVLMMDEYTMEPQSVAVWDAKTNKATKVDLDAKAFIGAGAGKTGWVLVKQEDKALSLWELK